MCIECDKRNGTDFFSEKKEAEKEVSPQSNATLTVLTPGPDSQQTDNVTTPEGNVVPNLNQY